MESIQIHIRRVWRKSALLTLVSGSAVAMLFAPGVFAAGAKGKPVEIEVPFGIEKNEGAIAFELKQQALDFRRRLQEQEREERERMRGVEALKKERAKDEEQLERARQQYLRERERRPVIDEEAMEAKMQKEQEQLSKPLEQARKDFIRKRQALQKVYETNRVLSESEEYGLPYLTEAPRRSKSRPIP